MTSIACSCVGSPIITNNGQSLIKLDLSINLSTPLDKIIKPLAIFNNNLHLHIGAYDNAYLQRMITSTRHELNQNHIEFIDPNNLSIGRNIPNTLFTQSTITTSAEFNSFPTSCFDFSDDTIQHVLFLGKNALGTVCAASYIPNMKAMLEESLARFKEEIDDSKRIILIISNKLYEKILLSDIKLYEYFKDVFVLNEDKIYEITTEIIFGKIIKYPKSNTDLIIHTGHNIIMLFTPSAIQTKTSIMTNCRFKLTIDTDCWIEYYIIIDGEFDESIITTSTPNTTLVSKQTETETETDYTAMFDTHNFNIKLLFEMAILNAKSLHTIEELIPYSNSSILEIYKQFLDMNTDIKIILDLQKLIIYLEQLNNKLFIMKCEEHSINRTQFIYVLNKPINQLYMHAAPEMGRQFTAC